MATTQAPQWFQDAVQHPFEREMFPVGDRKLRALRWRDPSARGIPTLALHGGMAHAEWWRFVAPLLLPKHDVVAIDLSGHGESDRREDYHFDSWIDEICAAAKHFFGDQRVLLLGHSMGGLLSVKTAAKHPHLWRGLVISDAPLHKPFGREPSDEEPPLYIKRDYPDYDTAVNRFRLVPEQPVTHPFLVRFLAETSVRQRNDGSWTWKFDPGLFKSMTSIPFAQDLAQLKAPLWFLRAAKSKIVPAKARRALARHCNNSWRWLHIEDAYHHIMLDRPHAFVETVLSLPTEHTS